MMGEAANGIVNVDLWEPVPTMQFPGVMDFIKKYQAKAPAEGVDLLGYFLPPFAYSELQILGDAITATKTLDDDKLADLEKTYPGLSLSGDVKFSALTYNDAEKAKPADWLAEHGWAVEPVRTNPELQAEYGRTPPEVDLQVDQIMHSEYITATR